MYSKYEKLKEEMHVRDSVVARETGIAKSTFSDWKKGKSKPKLDKIAKLAKFFNVPIEYFLEEGDV